MQLSANFVVTVFLALACASNAHLIQSRDLPQLNDLASKLSPMVKSLTVSLQDQRDSIGSLMSDLDAEHLTVEVVKPLTDRIVATLSHAGDEMKLIATQTDQASDAMYESSSQRKRQLDLPSLNVANQAVEDLEASLSQLGGAIQKRLAVLPSTDDVVGQVEETLSSSLGRVGSNVQPVHPGRMHRKRLANALPLADTLTQATGALDSTLNVLQDKRDVPLASSLGSLADQLTNLSIQLSQMLSQLQDAGELTNSDNLLNALGSSVATLRAGGQKLAQAVAPNQQAMFQPLFDSFDSLTNVVDLKSLLTSA